MNEWTYLHRYNRLVDEERAAVLGCPDCQNEFAWVIGEKDEPVAWCVYDDKRFYPGAYFWERIKRAVKESEDE